MARFFTLNRMTDVGLVIYDSQMCNLKNSTVCFMHLECAIYKSQIYNNTSQMCDLSRKPSKTCYCGLGL